MDANSHLTLRPIRIALGLLVVAATLVVLNLGAQALRIFGHDTLFGFGPLLAFTDPQALVHLWIALLLFACAALVGLLTYLRDRKGEASGYWAGLVMLFIFLGIDEGIDLHAVLTLPVRALFPHVDLLHAGWVLPYGILLAGIALAYLPFVWTLTLRSATWLALAATLYYIGLIVCGAFAGRALLAGGDHWSFAYSIYVTAGAALKLGGLAVLVYALLDRLAREFPDLQLRLARPASAVSPEPMSVPAASIKDDN